MSKPLLRIQNFALSFAPRHGPVTRAVESVDLTLFPRQTVAIVGESGSGKSVTALSTLGLLDRPPARYDRGQMLLDIPGAPAPVDLLTLSERELRPIRGRQIAMIFQEPMTSLNPVYSIGDQIIEAVMLHQKVGRKEARSRAIESLREVMIAKPEERADAYPHQFSGGMRQRVMIAMALACNPAILVADEPTTALDVTVQSQILDLFADLKARRGMSVLLITHALGVVAESADVVCVMFAGRVVEYATVFDLFDNPLHPYTRGLLACIPGVVDRAERLTTIKDVVDNESQFTKLGDGRRPWWPRHTAPAHTTLHPQTGLDSQLVEVTPGHFVALWRTADMPAEQAPPSLPFLRQPDSDLQPLARQ